MTVITLHPNALEHWKVKILKRRLGSGPAVLCMLELWSYCAKHSLWVWRLTPTMLAGICDFSGSPEQLWFELNLLGLIRQTPEDPLYYRVAAPSEWLPDLLA